MTRILWFLIVVLALAAGLSWLADKPGNIAIDWEGYKGELSVFTAVVGLMLATALATMSWIVLRHLWTTPASLGRLLMKRKQKRGLDALSAGMIAVGAGDRSSATRYALAARKTLPNEPLTHLLRAQAAQLSGDKATARRIFEAMLGAPDTEQLGLRGLYLEALRMKEAEAARQFAERAVNLNPRLSWPVEGLFDLQCKTSDWGAALDTLAIARKHGHADKATADRRRAVLLAAQAQALEESDAEKALTLALEAHGLAPSLIPAAAIAGRILAARGATPKAAKVIQKTWAKAPHPDLAQAYAFARIGDSPRDRLDRVKQLALLNPHSIESPIAVANAAIDARDFSEARRALAPLLEGRLTQRVATLMARIEGGEQGDKGRVREWLARAVNAPRDPAWTADGSVSEKWAAISPVTGKLDAFEWRVPVDELEAIDGEELSTRLESLVPLGAEEREPTHAGTAASPAGPASPARESAARDVVAKAAGPSMKPRPEADDAEIIEQAPAPKAARGGPSAAAVELDAGGQPGAELVAAQGESERRREGLAAASGIATRNGRSESVREPALAEASRTIAGTADAREMKSSRTEAAGSARARNRRKGEAQHAEPHIFISPRAPDDPGTEDAEEVAAAGPRPSRPA